MFPITFQLGIPNHKLHKSAELRHLGNEIPHPTLGSSETTRAAPSMQHLRTERVLDLRLGRAVPVYYVLTPHSPEIREILGWLGTEADEAQGKSGCVGTARRGVHALLPSSRSGPTLHPLES